jgi:multicomponent Na+:H+ antiporter subunit B
VSDSLILRTATRALLPVLGLLSIFMLLRGHNEPGGGFIGGLLAAAGIALHQLACGVEKARCLMRFDPRSVIGAGLLLALLSALLPLAWGRPLLTGLWLATPVPGVGKLGTPLLFDIGVWLVVLGTVTLMLFTLGRRGDR